MIDELNTTIVITDDIELSIKIADTIWPLGRDFYAHGQPIHGARIKYQYNLIERGLAWHPDIENTPEFFALGQELKARFLTP